MARKKEFDPLGGSISSEKPKKIRKNNPILGSKEHTGSSSVYDEADHGPLSGYGIDALTADGRADKPKKEGFCQGSSVRENHQDDPQNSLQKIMLVHLREKNILIG